MSQHLCRLIIFLAFATPLAAQSTGTGTITGFVSDKSGAFVPGAEISVTHLPTGIVRRFVTNDKGLYVATALPVGPYEIKAELQGFKGFLRYGVRVEAESRQTINITLEVGEISETVTVTSTSVLVQSETGEVSTLVSGTQVTELALNGRNFTQFLTLGPG